MQDAPPAEAQRGAVGHFGQSLDRLRTGKEAQRARGSAGLVIAGEARSLLAMAAFAVQPRVF